MEIKDSRDIYWWLKKEEEIWRNHQQTLNEWALCCDKRWVAIDDSFLQQLKDGFSSWDEAHRTLTEIYNALTKTQGVHK